MHVLQSDVIMPMLPFMRQCNVISLRHLQSTQTSSSRYNAVGVRAVCACAACMKPEAKKAAVSALRKTKPAAASSPAPRRPASRKPVGTPARAAGKRAASVPARLRPLDNTPYRRTQAQGSVRLRHKPAQRILYTLLAANQSWQHMIPPSAAVQTQDQPYCLAWRSTMLLRW